VATLPREMPSPPRPLWPVILLALAVPLTFAAFTHHAWEDYFITARTSRNLVEGHGLVFNPGERLHTFTSPLGVLVPALCTWIAGVGRDEAALWIFRVLNAACLATAAALMWRRMVTLGISLFGRSICLGIIVADAKLTDFSINGMETAILAMFVMLLWSELEATSGPRISRVALATAGLMWTRPDGFILAIALVAPHLALRRRKTDAPPLPWRAILAGALLGGLLYLPWFGFAWWYYDSPIPHTIIAKAAVTPPVDLRNFFAAPWRTVFGDSMLMDVFLPTYWFYGSWPAVLPSVARAITIVAAFAWAVPFLPLPARRLSLAVFIGAFYVSIIILFPWYSPPWMMLAALAFGFTIDAALGGAIRRGRPWLASGLRVVAALVVAGQAALLIATAWEMRVQQRLIEYGVRRPIGEWLHANAAADDTVFLEPLGYIGYYSNLKMFDYPGLSSKEVVAAIATGHRRLTEVIAELHPTWLVLRPFEFADPNQPANAALRNYQLVRTWNVRPQLDAVTFLPGRGWLEHDAEFRVYHRQSSARLPPAATINSAPPPAPPTVSRIGPRHS
jgi:hypothetical protein